MSRPCGCRHSRGAFLEKGTLLNENLKPLRQADVGMASLCPGRQLSLSPQGLPGLLSGFTHQSKGSVGIWMLAWPSAKQWVCCDGPGVARLSLSVAVLYTLLDAQFYVLLLCSV